MKIYIQIKKHLSENDHNYKDVTIALFCYQNDLNINTTESWIKENCQYTLSLYLEFFVRFAIKLIITNII